MPFNADPFIPPGRDGTPGTGDDAVQDFMLRISQIHVDIILFIK
jgi:hypothetical protein